MELPLAVSALSSTGPFPALALAESASTWTHIISAVAALSSNGMDLSST